MNEQLSSVHELIDTILKVRFTDLEKERSCCEALLNLAEQQNSIYAKTFAYTYLGDYFLAQNDPIKSGQYLFQAKQMCAKRSYPALYMKICHLCGFYYHLICDEQNALQYYLESISLAEELGDYYQVCNAWNNIADMFQRRKQFEEAKGYYLKSYQAIRDHDFDDSRLKIIILYNLSEIYCYTHDLEQAENYLALCETVEHVQPNEHYFHLLCCKTGRFLQASISGDIERAMKLAKEILDKKFFQVEDKYIIVESLLPITHMLIDLKEKEYATKYIEVLNQFHTEDEISFMQRFVDLRVYYAETFSDYEQLFLSYQEYCQAMRKLVAIEDGVRVSGMNAKINLHDVVREHESTLEENKRLADEVLVDGLTDLYNRRFMNQELEKLKQQDGEQEIGIIMLDIDYFKEYNDTYGHIHGDLVLREIANILKEKETKEVFPCRYGGDEFCIFCFHQSSDAIKECIQSILSQVQELAMPHLQSKCAKQVTLSIGYSLEELNSQKSFEPILEHADQALYETKLNGRNGWHCYQEMTIS